MNLTSPRLWIAGTAFVCVVVVAAGWFLLISPKRAEAADLREQTTATEQRNALLRSEIAELEKQFERLPELREELAAVKTAMPEDVKLAVLTRDIQRIADESGVILVAVRPGLPVPVVATTPAAAPAAPAEGTDPAAAAAAAPTSAAVPGLAQVPVTIEVKSDFAKTEAFLQALQTTLGRDYLVDGLAIVAVAPADAVGAMPATVNGDITSTVTGRVFVLSEGTTAPAAATPAAPATVNN